MIKIPYSKQHIDEDDIIEVNQALKSQFLTTGPKIEEFEKAINKTTNIFYNVCCSSGTAALHMALMAIGAGPGDEVIVPGMSFVATANVVEYVGAVPVFADVDPDTLLIEVESVSSLITDKTIAIIGVDMCGQKPDYEGLDLLNEKIYIIADAAHNFGGHDNFSSKHIDLICYSFHPVKHITTGEGGAVATNNFLFFNRLKAIRNHGRSDGDMIMLGYNYRLSDINAALGISQLDKFNDFIYKRIKIAEKYLSIPEINKISLKRAGYHTNHIFIIKVGNRKSVIDYLNRYGITTQIHYKPIYENKYYIDKYGFIKLENIEQIKDKILSIPLYPDLEEKEQDFIISKLLNVI